MAKGIFDTPVIYILETTGLFFEILLGKYAKLRYNAIKD
jgi:hypothetical protein